MNRALTKIAASLAFIIGALAMTIRLGVVVSHLKLNSKQECACSIHT